MVGRTLSDIRTRLDDLSVAVGPFRIVCGRTGDAPFPVTGRQFPDRETAAEAASVASAYRAALRRYDPEVAVHDLIVAQAAVDGETDAEASPSLPEYCHSVSGALFEVLSDRHGPVERAVMDRYLAAAETTEDRETLCLEMLRSTASALDAQLAAAERSTVLLAAADRLPSRSVGPRPFVDALDSLRFAGLVGSFDVESAPSGPGRRPRRISLTGYRPAASTEQFPALPIVVELLRRTGVPPRISWATRTASGWELLLSTTADGPADSHTVIVPGK